MNSPLAAPYVTILNRSHPRAELTDSDCSADSEPTLLASSRYRARSPHRRLTIAVALLGVLINDLPADSVPRHPSPSSTVSPGAWTHMVEQIERDRLALREVVTEERLQEWHFGNVANEFAARVDQRGLSLRSSGTQGSGWQMRMEFTGYGRGTRLSLPAAVATTGTGNRLEARRSGITEWWQNETAGVEHGFRIEASPPGNAAIEPLRLALSLREGLRARPVSTGAQGIELADATGVVIRYGGLRVTDARGRLLSAWMEVEEGGTEIRIVSRDAAAEYPLVVDPTFVLARQFPVPSDMTVTNVGASVAISGDIAVVGAVKIDDRNGYTFGSGGAYVFQRESGGTDQWGLIKKLTVSDSPIDDRFGAAFGAAVAVEGNWIAVGAPYAASPNPNAHGLVHLFERNTGGANNWGEFKQLFTSAKLTLSGQFEGYPSRFGSSVAISGNTLVVGVLSVNFLIPQITKPISPGSAHVFERDFGGSDNWGEVTRLQPSVGVNPGFGRSVAIDGDVAVVGWTTEAYNETTGVCIFRRNAGGVGKWGLEKANLRVSQSAPRTRLGYSVAVRGDTVVVGAPGLGYSLPTVLVGTVMILGKNVGGANQWGIVKEFPAGDGGSGQLFGYAVSLADDFLAVGSPRAAIEGRGNQGTIYLYQRNAGGTTNWGQIQKLTAPAGAAGDAFGSSVAQQPGLLMTGAPGTDQQGVVDQGAAFLFILPAAAPVILKQPLNAGARLAGSATFQVTIDAYPPANYQWWFNETTVIANATNLLLKLQNIKETDFGAYQIVVSNAVGVVTSTVATLTKLLLPVITSQPQPSLTVFEGDPASFSVSVDGTRPFGFKWRKGTTTVFNIANVDAGSSTYTIPSAQLTDAGNYSVIVTNLASPGSPIVASLNSVLTVLRQADVGLQLIASPSSLKSGELVTVTATATNRTVGALSSNLVLTLHLPVDTQVVSTESPGGNCTVTGNEIVCGRDLLTNGEAYVLTAVVRPHALGSVMLTATVSAFTKDPDISNNTATTLLTLAAGAPIITGVAIQDGYLVFTLATESGRTYQLVSAPAVTGPWLDEGDPIQGDGMMQTLKVGGKAEQPERYFRIRRD